jgi:hypothetical protein
VRLSGSSTNTATSGGWRFADLKVTSPGTTNPAGAFKTSFLFDDLLIYKMDIGPTGFGFNVSFDQSGLSTPHKYYGLVDTQLRGNTGVPVQNGGSCYFGGASHQFISGVTCGQANAWQMRIAYTHKAVISNNIVAETAGAFEAIKFHCSIGSVVASGVSCSNMIFSDNLIAKEHVNLGTGSVENQAKMENSIYERNVMPHGVSTVHPNNVFRYNVMSGVVIRPRPNRIDSAEPRNNVIEQNTCDRRGGSISRACVYAEPNTIYDGTIVRNNLVFRPGTSPLPVFVTDSPSGGAVTQVGNVSATASPFVNANPNPLVRADFALRPDATTFIDKGVPLRFRVFDLLGHLAPQGAAPEIGAAEVETGGTPVVDGPPAPPVLLSVDVQP